VSCKRIVQVSANFLPYYSTYPGIEGLLNHSVTESWKYL
jgi:hypothetical protein